jgi:hypothetical protein
VAEGERGAAGFLTGAGRRRADRKQQTLLLMVTKPAADKERLKQSFPQPGFLCITKNFSTQQM